MFILPVGKITLKHNVIPFFKPIKPLNKNHVIPTGSYPPVMSVAIYTP